MSAGGLPVEEVEEVDEDVLEEWYKQGNKYFLLQGKPYVLYQPSQRGKKSQKQNFKFAIRPVGPPEKGDWVVCGGEPDCKCDRKLHYTCYPYELCFSSGKQTSFVGTVDGRRVETAVAERRKSCCTCNSVQGKLYPLWKYIRQYLNKIMKEKVTKKPKRNKARPEDLVNMATEVSPEEQQGPLDVLALKVIENMHLLRYKELSSASQVFKQLGNVGMPGGHGEDKIKKLSSQLRKLVEDLERRQVAKAPPEDYMLTAMEEDLRERFPSETLVGLSREDAAKRTYELHKLHAVGFMEKDIEYQEYLKYLGYLRAKGGKLVHWVETIKSANARVRGGLDDNSESSASEPMGDSTMAGGTRLRKRGRGTCTEDPGCLDEVATTRSVQGLTRPGPLAEAQPAAPGGPSQVGGDWNQHNHQVAGTSVCTSERLSLASAPQPMGAGAGPSVGAMVPMVGLPPCTLCTLHNDDPLGTPYLAHTQNEGPWEGNHGGALTDRSNGHLGDLYPDGTDPYQDLGVDWLGAQEALPMVEDRYPVPSTPPSPSSLDPRELWDMAWDPTTFPPHRIPTSAQPHQQLQVQLQQALMTVQGPASIGHVVGQQAGMTSVGTPHATPPPSHLISSEIGPCRASSSLPDGMTQVPPEAANAPGSLQSPPEVGGMAGQGDVAIRPPQLGMADPGGTPQTGGRLSPLVGPVLTGRRVSFHLTGEINAIDLVGVIDNLNKANIDFVLKNCSTEQSELESQKEDYSILEELFMAGQTADCPESLLDPPHPSPKKRARASQEMSPCPHASSSSCTSGDVDPRLPAGCYQNTLPTVTRPSVVMHSTASGVLRTAPGHSQAQAQAGSLSFEGPAGPLTIATQYQDPPAVPTPIMRVHRGSTALMAREAHTSFIAPQQQTFQRDPPVVFASGTQQPHLMHGDDAMGGVGTGHLPQGHPCIAAQSSVANQPLVNPHTPLQSTWSQGPLNIQGPIPLFSVPALSLQQSFNQGRMLTAAQQPDGLNYGTLVQVVTPQHLVVHCSQMPVCPTPSVGVQPSFPPGVTRSPGWLGHVEEGPPVATCLLPPGIACHGRSSAVNTMPGAWTGTMVSPLNIGGAIEGDGQPPSSRHQYPCEMEAGTSGQAGQYGDPRHMGQRLVGEAFKGGPALPARPAAALIPGSAASSHTSVSESAPQWYYWHQGYGGKTGGTLGVDSCHDG